MICFFVVFKFCSRTHILHNFQSMLLCRWLYWLTLHPISSSATLFSLPSQKEKTYSIYPISCFLKSWKTFKLTHIQRNRRRKKRGKNPSKFATANQLHGSFYAWHFICVTFFLRFILVLNYWLSSFNDFYFVFFFVQYFSHIDDPWHSQSTAASAFVHALIATKMIYRI